MDFWYLELSQQSRQQSRLLNINCSSYEVFFTSTAVASFDSVGRDY